MPKKLVVLAALALIATTHVEAQDQQQQQAPQSQPQPQSLAEIARQTRKAKEEKEKASGAPKIVVSDETLVSSSGARLAFEQPGDAKGPASMHSPMPRSSLSVPSKSWIDLIRWTRQRWPGLRC